MMGRSNLWSRLALWRQGLLAAAILAAGVLQAMDQYNIKKTWAWVHSDKVLFWVTVLAGGLVLLNTLGDVIAQRRSVAGEGRRIDIHQAVIGALAAISQESKLVITDLGANVFRVRCWWGYRTFTVRSRTIHLGRRPRLVRVERIRLSDFPAKSNVPWTQGKGVIGDCWEHGRAEYVNWAPIAKKWTAKSISATQWAGIPEADKTGFSREEFMEMVGKYAEIRAVPIKDDQGNVTGVLAVDRVWRAAGPTGQFLKGPSVEETVTSAASVLQSVLGGR